MCGVGGIIAPYAKPRWKASMMDRLLRGAEVRGKDATGICFIDSQRGMVIIKDGKPAREFLYNDEAYKKESENFPSIVLGHCRQATKRSNTGPEDNKNNHPFYAKESGIAMIHNGVIDNDDNWRDTVGQEGGLKNKPESPVDSEVMLMAVETFYLSQPPETRTLEEAIDNACYTIAGSYALAFLKTDEPNKVRFVRHGNPLSFAWVPSQKAILFGSTDTIVEEALEYHKEYLDYFIETISVPAIVNDMNEDTLVTMEILPPDAKVPFKITSKNLDCAKNDVRARHYIHENIDSMVD